MSVTISGVVDAIHPSDEATGVVVGDEIWVIFSEEVDETSIENGNLFVTGPDFNTWSGPDQATWTETDALFENPQEDEILESPGYEGILQGTWTFERLDLSTTSGVSTQDTSGDGGLYRTKAVFTPDTKLAAETEYTVYLFGDEDDTDELKSGVRPRSVFDPVITASGSNDIEFSGTYIGTHTAEDTINVEVVTSGVCGNATFKWWYSSAGAGSESDEIRSDSSVFIQDGVYIHFGDGVFETGDTYTVKLKRKDPYTSSIIWTFTTGSGSIVEVPDETSTSAIGNLVPETSVSSDELGVLSITPSDRATHQSLTTSDIIVKLDSDIDPATVTSDRVQLMAYPVNGDEDLMSEREIYKDITVSGSTLTIHIGEPVEAD